MTHVAFDKTGTLTRGRPVVTDVMALGRGEDDVLSLAGVLETGSSHPLARAILARANEAGAPTPPATHAKALGGKGVTVRIGGLDLFLGSPTKAADRAAFIKERRLQVSDYKDAGKTVAALTVDGTPGGLIAMRDEPRPDAGDGINDAPALAAADEGIAMGGGTDVAMETADATVLHGRVTDLSRMVGLARRTMTNIGIALDPKAAILATTVLEVTGSGRPSSPIPAPRSW